MKKLSALLGIAALAPLASGQIVINEIRIDQPGTDIDEYFELLGPALAPLTGLTYLVIGDGTGGSGTIENVTDLNAESLDAFGFFVAAESTFTLGTANLTTTVNFENSDNVTHMLVSGFTGANGDDLDTDDDGVLDVTPWTSIVDVVALIEEANPPTGTEFHYGGPICGPDGSFTPGHFFRETNGGGLIHFAVGAFDPTGGQDTPGAANATRATLPSAFGGGMGMMIDVGAGSAGDLYLIGLSASGTAPGIPFGSVLVPLNFDALLSFSIANANSTNLQGTFGFLDGSGQALARAVFPGLPGLAGLSVNAAAVILDSVTLDPILATNAVTANFF